MTIETEIQIRQHCEMLRNGVEAQAPVEGKPVLKALVDLLEIALKDLHAIADRARRPGP